MANDTYNSAQKRLHWFNGLIIIILLAIGFSLQFLPSSTLKQNMLHSHKIMGIMSLLTVLIRTLLRFKFPVTAPNIPKLMQKCGKISHICLYVLIFTMPLSGWIMSSAVQKMPSFFYVFIPGVPHSKALAKNMYDLHNVCAYCLLFFITLHISATIFHTWRKEPVLSRMLFKS